MASMRPPDRLAARSKSNASTQVNAGNALRLLHQELSSVPDREPFVADESDDKTENERPGLSGRLTSETIDRGLKLTDGFGADPKSSTTTAASAAAASTNARIVKTIRAAISDIRQP
jgi:hypothetical protein